MMVDFDPDRPSDYERMMAAITDTALVAEVRDAITAVGWCFDAWWADARKVATTYDTKRAKLVVAVRAQIRDLGAHAPAAALCDAARPLLGEFWPQSPGAAAALDEAMEAMRRTVMSRAPAVLAARAKVVAWDARHQPG